MPLQSLPKTKASASKRLLQKECMDGKSPVLSACGAKTESGTLAVEVGSRAMKSRAVKVLAKPAAAHAGVVICQELAVQSRALEHKTEAPSFRTEIQGSSVAASPARQDRGSPEGCRTFGGEKVGPNPSVKRSAIGRPPGPRAAVVYPASRGPGVLPLSPAYLQR